MKSRNWVFTNFKLDFDWDAYYENETRCNFIAYGNEVCPTTGRGHQQGYIRFSSPLAGTSRILPGIRTDVMRGSFKQNEAYCSKEASLVKYGKEPAQGERRDIEAILKSIKDTGESEVSIAESNPNQWIQYGRRFEDYRMLLIPKRSWKTEVICYWGPTGTGKTHKVFEETGGDVATVSWHGDFCIGYNGERNVLLDDFDPRTISRELFLKLTDRYPMKVNVKHDPKGREWSPARLYLTSNYNPVDWAHGTCPAVQGRFTKIVHMEQKFMEQKCP